MKARARRPRLAVATVLVEGFLGRLTFGMVSFALPLYALSTGMSVGEAGLLVSLRTILLLGLKPVAGWLADRVGVRSVYLAGVFARVAAAGALLVSGDFVSLALVRLLQGASAAGRDVASLGLIVRDAEKTVGSVYGWYATAKHVGGVAGAGLAGLIIALSAGAFTPLFVVVLASSVVPFGVAWFGLREVPLASVDADVDDEEQIEGPAETPVAPAARSPGLVSSLRDLGGPASVGMLVASSAYMVHGMFPILATEYAGLTEAQAGIIYSISAAVFAVAGPAFGWLVDRYGRVVGIAYRSAANIGSSALYLLFPSFVGLALARSVDDSGKAAFRPAWASTVADITAGEPRRRIQRLGVLDTSQSVGEAVGPMLAGFLWQTGGVVWLFGARIAIAIVAEIAALRVFGELRDVRLRPSPRLTTVGHLAPPALTIAIAGLWLFGASRGETALGPIQVAIASAIALAGVVVGAFIGGFAAAAQRRLVDDLDHDLRSPVTIIRGEVELVLSRGDLTEQEREQSSRTVIAETERLEEILRTTV